MQESAKRARVWLVEPQRDLSQLLIELLAGEGFGVRSCCSVPEITRAYLAGQRGVAVIDVDELARVHSDADRAAVLALSRVMPVIAVGMLPPRRHLDGCHVLNDVFGDLDGLVHEVADAAATLSDDAVPELRGTF